MKLDYGTQISPYPIALSIGSIKKPKLKDIADTKKGMSFDKFSYYLVFIKMTPEKFYTEIQRRKDYWDFIPDEQKENISLYDIILKEESLQNLYVDILNFFFVETVVFEQEMFILLKPNVDTTKKIKKEDISGVIKKELFVKVLDLIQQICCIKDYEEDISKETFKNNIAKKLFERLRKAKKEVSSKKLDLNLTMPNIISSLSNKHPSLNYTNIWNITIFQLYDSFEKIRINTIFDIDSRRISIWGDKNKSFDPNLWYRNNYDKKSQPI